MQSIKNHNGYFITEDGQFFSKVKRHNQPIKIRKISKWVKNGYHAVTLGNKSFYVHRLVLETFIGDCPKGMEAIHKNGNRQDNRIENLCWDTRVRNQSDRNTHGTHNKGIRHGKHILVDREVYEIKHMIEQGKLHKEIARLFKVHKSTISSIATGRSWKHIK